MVAAIQPEFRAQPRKRAALRPRSRPCVRESGYPRFSPARLGRRFYSPALGKWLSRDPSEQYVMYTFVYNCVPNNVDPVGLAIWTKPGTIRNKGNRIMGAIGYHVEWWPTRDTTEFYCKVCLGQEWEQQREILVAGTTYKYYCTWLGQGGIGVRQDKWMPTQSETGVKVIKYLETSPTWTRLDKVENEKSQCKSYLESYKKLHPAAPSGSQ